jgi:hypothetical protein
MRYLFLIRSSHQAMPPPELLTAMHLMAVEEVKAGRMIADGGLMPPQAGAEIHVVARKLRIMDGPFAETKEVIGGFAIFELPDDQAARESAARFMALHLEHMPDWEGVCEMRQIAGSQVEMIRAGG